MKYVLLVLLLVVVCLPSNPASAGSGIKGQLGIQLWSLRDTFSKDVPGGLDQVKKFGLTYVETAGTYNMEPAKFREMLDAKGLKAVSSHFPYERFRDDPEGVAKDAKILGATYVGVAWIPHGDPFDEKTAREAIAVFNRAGEAVSKHGLKFFYHAHGYEFAPQANGSTLFDLIMAETKPEYVSIEMDVFWMLHPGQDPVKLFEKYGSRFQLMHVKDMKKGTPTGLFTGGSDVNNNVVVGTGVADWPAIFKAAKKAGVKWYFIEDESSSVVAQVPQSVRYLETVKF